MNKSSFLIATALFSTALLGSTSRAQVIAPVAPPAATMTETDLRNLGEGIAFPYEKLDSALKDNVSKEGNVFYAKLKGNNDLETFVRAVAIADLKKFPNWMTPPDPDVPNSKETPDQTPQLTFWINAYNALFLKAIADAYPISGPSQIKGLDTDKTRVVAGENYSFADLRKKIAGIDPRALFTLPDGTNAGPRASQYAYRYLGLNTQLNNAVKAFVNDTSRVEPPNRLQSAVRVSPFFATVDEYFRPKNARRKWQGVRNVLAGYTLRSADQGYFNSSEYQIDFALKDNRLNEQFNSIHQ